MFLLKTLLNDALTKKQKCQQMSFQILFQGNILSNRPKPYVEVNVVVYINICKCAFIEIYSMYFKV